MHLFVEFSFYNKGQLNESFSPASTFKICNSLIGLETGVIKDENFVLPWNGVEYFYGVWNKDHDLHSAFQNSVVWYYQELARRVGGERMNYWLKKSGYGNMDTTGGIDKFWLTGKLRVTPAQQIDFLQKLNHNKLSFSQRSMDIVKKIMIAKEEKNYTLRAKTGWADEENSMVGWYVGYVTTKDNVYYFSNCVQTNNMEHPDFANSTERDCLQNSE